MNPRTKILFIHGAFGSSVDFAPWSGFFTAEGFECVVPPLPGHEPTDPDALRTLSMPDYLRALLALRAGMAEAPIVIGHSMGGLLGQQLAAATPCRALIGVASTPPGILTTHPLAFPHLGRPALAIVTGRPVRPTEASFRALACQDLAPEEQREIYETRGYESGLAYRQMILGRIRVAPDAVRCPMLCLSGGRDRIVSPRLSRSIARHYGAKHHVFPAKGHWLIAPSAVEEVAGTALRWLRSV